MASVKIIEVLKEEEGIRLDRWFKKYYPNISHIIIEKLLRKGQIRVDGKRVKSNYRLDIGQQIRFMENDDFTKNEKIDKKNTKINIDQKYIKLIQDAVIYKDKNVIAINKPQGLAVQGGKNIKISVDDLCEYLKFEYKEKPSLVHRLDKDTSGLLLLARNLKTASKLTGMFRQQEIEKKYWAVIVGCPKILKGKIDAPIKKMPNKNGKEKMVVDEDGQKSLTYYEVVESLGKNLYLVSLSPKTGRTHQLRVHLSYIGCPILGDGKYGGKKAFIDNINKNMRLHAKSIFIRDFFNKELMLEADAPLGFFGKE